MLVLGIFLVGKPIKATDTMLSTRSPTRKWPHLVGFNQLWNTEIDQKLTLKLSNSPWVSGVRWKRFQRS